jgi:hypothetical protein
MGDPFPHPKSHARHRCQRRGTTRSVWNTLHAYADVATHVGHGATSHSISRAAAREMKADGIASDEIDRARRRAVVEIDGTPMTLIAGRQSTGQHYFHNRPRGQSDKRIRRRR